MYDDDKLKSFRRNFLESERPDDLAALSIAGELETHLQEHADACRRRAAELVASGQTFDGQAWQWAIRSVLLERPYD